MKPESLHALFLDRELGELPSETAELLEAWVTEHPECATAVPSIRATLETTRAAVRRFPELARPECEVIAFPVPRFRLVPLALAASVLILVGGSASLGFHAGQQSGQKALAASRGAPVNLSPANAVKHDGPWARYAFASNPRGGLTVVRRDTNHQP